MEERGERIEQDAFFSFFLLGSRDLNPSNAPTSKRKGWKEEKPPTIDAS